MQHKDLRHRREDGVGLGAAATGDVLLPQGGEAARGIRVARQLPPLGELVGEAVSTRDMEPHLAGERRMVRTTRRKGDGGLEGEPRLAADTGVAVPRRRRAWARITGAGRFRVAVQSALP